MDLKRLPKHFKKNREIVLAAVRNDGFAIADADRKLTMDRDILTLVGLEKHIKKGEKWSL